VSISNAVQAKLMTDPRSGFPRINVDTVRGVVTLSGMVETEAQRDQAERLTHQVAGVLKVENNIQTQNQPRHSSNAEQAHERKAGIPPW
jgi:hyperosmotically inducible protein